jgi:hypothetical protein
MHARQSPKTLDISGEFRWHKVQIAIILSKVSGLASSSRALFRAGSKNKDSTAGAKNTKPTRPRRHKRQGIYLQAFFF